MKRATNSKTKRLIRHQRIRQIINGTTECPRVSVFRSNEHLVVQVIDDQHQKTLLSVTSRGQKLSGRGIEKASQLGAKLAEQIKSAGIKKIVFDRGGYAYHGRIKALAEALRAQGINY